MTSQVQVPVPQYVYISIDDRWDDSSQDARPHERWMSSSMSSFGKFSTNISPPRRPIHSQVVCELDMYDSKEDLRWRDSSYTSNDSVHCPLKPQRRCSMMTNSNYITNIGISLSHHQSLGNERYERRPKITAAHSA